MQVHLSIVEKALGQTERQAFSLKLASERVPAIEVLTQHVISEVDRLNAEMKRNAARHDRVASFLVGSHAHETQRKLNGPSGRAPRFLDPGTEVKAAVKAIKEKRVIMLFDEREVADLDAPLTLTDDSNVTFLRLVPLVGG